MCNLVSWATWSSWRCPCSLQRRWARWPLKVPSNPKHSVILCILHQPQAQQLFHTLIILTLTRFTLSTLPQYIAFLHCIIMLLHRNPVLQGSFYRCDQWRPLIFSFAVPWIPAATLKDSHLLSSISMQDALKVRSFISTYVWVLNYMFPNRKFKAQALKYLN